MRHPTRTQTGFLFLALAVSVAGYAEENFRTADPDANQDVRRILAWLRELPKRDSKRVVSGQYGWADTEKTFEQAGKWPALYEDCLWQVGSSTWDHWPLAEPNRKRMKELWDKGTLVSIHMPIPNPKTKTRQQDRDLTDEEFRMAADPNSEIGKNFLQWIDRLAVHLAWLQEQGVTVFIRPLHEMTGNWFWYGKRDPGDFKKLFRYTVNYLVKEKKLHNLIIVFAPNRYPPGRGPSSTVGAIADYYPGDDIVDMVGIDTYSEPPLTIKTEYEALSRFPKPLAVTELGWHARDKTPAGSRNSKAEIIGAIRKDFPKVVMWSAWTNNNSPAHQNNCRDLYADPLVISRGEAAWKK